MQNLSNTPKYLPESFQSKLRRIAWLLIDSTFIRFSPKYAYSFRNYLLKLFGARIGFKAGIKPSTRILMPWNLVLHDWISFGKDVRVMNYSKLEVESHVVISEGVFLCGGSHDYLSPSLPLVSGEILIKSRTWICAEAFIGLNVVIGEDCVVAARSVVVKSVDPNSVVGGNPARFIKTRYFLYDSINSSR